MVLLLMTNDIRVANPGESQAPTCLAKLVTYPCQAVRTSCDRWLIVAAAPSLEQHSNRHVDNNSERLAELIPVWILPTQTTKC